MQMQLGKILREKAINMLQTCCLEIMTSYISKSDKRITTLLESKLQLSTRKSAVQNNYGKSKSLIILLDERVITYEVYRKKSKYIFKKL
jgi:hypothetical protein